MGNFFILILIFGSVFLPKIDQNIVHGATAANWKSPNLLFGFAYMTSILSLRTMDVNGQSDCPGAQLSTVPWTRVVGFRDPTTRSLPRQFWLKRIFLHLGISELLDDLLDDEVGLSLVLSLRMFCSFFPVHTLKLVTRNNAHHISG